jgi:hypothetical protein
MKSYYTAEGDIAYGVKHVGAGGFTRESGSGPG